MICGCRSVSVFDDVWVDVAGGSVEHWCCVAVLVSWAEDGLEGVDLAAWAECVFAGDEVLVVEDWCCSSACDGALSAGFVAVHVGVFCVEVDLLEVVEIYGVWYVAEACAEGVWLIGEEPEACPSAAGYAGDVAVFWSCGVVAVVDFGEEFVAECGCPWSCDV